MPLGEHKSEPLPKRVVMGSFDANGKFTRRIAVFDRLGKLITVPSDDKNKYGKASRAPSVSNNAITSRQGWAGLSTAGQEKKVFEVLQVESLVRE